MLRSVGVRAVRRALAQQQQRAFAEKAVAQQTFDWDALADLVHSDEGKRELGQLRSTYNEIAQRIANMTKEGESIDWANWSKQLDPKLVDGFRQAYDTMPLPKYDGNDVAESQAKFAALIKDASVMEAESAKRVVEIKDELAKIEAEKKRIATATIDEELAADPKLAAEIDAELERNNFMVTP